MSIDVDEGFTTGFGFPEVTFPRALVVLTLFLGELPVGVEVHNDPSVSECMERKWRILPFLAR